ncbi:fungal-specific transcription factor domain-containing protein [Armillaria luteobubalina]|uniref:Fungal-specific transcription factor domain-containing protein n=1 Tax=Armillaria luteobubalina TaxID=153913 RepID=A0AA39QDV6_9AGAR|nr:fungal-specific transcription factor domain-containing protein [Armillaria luteobubalina]
MPKEPEKKPRRKPGRVPTSCSECRRLKLRCDKNVPCEKCVSRGCGAICPDGSLTSGKGNRLILANTEQLHERIEHLCSRIRDLENALKTIQATISSEPHALLRADLLQLKSPQSTLPTQNGFSTEPQQARSDDENFIDAFGTLTIGRHGEASFLGKTARSEFLLRALSKPQSTSTLVLPRISKRIIESNCADPLDESLGHEIFSLLPPLSEAVHLCEVYLEHGKYLYSTVDRTELFDDVLSCVYRAESFASVSCHHTLYFLFSVFALAVLFDQERPAYSVEAQEYYYLARAAVGLSSINNHQTLRAVQGMTHLAEYEAYSDWESLGTNSEWITIGCAVKLGQSIGLHLNSSRWQLGEATSQRRSRVFWQLFTCDTWTSFFFGRPPSMSAQYIDCALPKDMDEIINEEGQRETGFHSWLWQYTTLMHSVMGAAFGVKVPAYTVILDLDRKIRDFPVPLRFRPCRNYGSDLLRPIHYMQRWMILMSKETVLLNLHRVYFAQALQDQPEDLAHHRYLPSVMATYRSAWRIMQSLKMLRTYAPLLSNRVNMAWSHALSAAIVMCILVTRAPNSKMTKPSLEELDLVAHLFEEAAPSCRAAANTLGQASSPESCDLSPDELDRLGGKTHLISSIDSDTPTVAYTPPPTARQPSPPSSSLPAANVHPVIAEDMRNLNVGGFHLNLFDNPAEVLPTEVSFTGDSYGFFAQQSPSLGEFTGAPTIQPPSQHSAFGFAAAAPMLDATWQSFVEQLGF